MLNWAWVVRDRHLSTCSGVAKVNEDNYTKEKQVNTERFELKASSPFTETFPEVQPLLVDLIQGV